MSIISIFIYIACFICWIFMILTLTKKPRIDYRREIEEFEREKRRDEFERELRRERERLDGYREQKNIEDRFRPRY